MKQVTRYQARNGKEFADAREAQREDLRVLKKELAGAVLSLCVVNRTAFHKQLERCRALFLQLKDESEAYFTERTPENVVQLRKAA